MARSVGVQDAPAKRDGGWIWRREAGSRNLLFPVKCDPIPWAWMTCYPIQPCKSDISAMFLPPLSSSLATVSWWQDPAFPPSWLPPQLAPDSPLPTVAHPLPWPGSSCLSPGSSQGLFLCLQLALLPPTIHEHHSTNVTMSLFSSNPFHEFPLLLGKSSLPAGRLGPS